MAARLIYLQRQKKKQELPDDNATMVMEGRLHARGQLNLVKVRPTSNPILLLYYMWVDNLVLIKKSIC